MTVFKNHMEAVLQPQLHIFRVAAGALEETDGRRLQRGHAKFRCERWLRTDDHGPEVHLVRTADVDRGERLNVDVLRRRQAESIIGWAREDSLRCVAVFGLLAESVDPPYCLK
jgi:hypothetical protein